MSKHLRRWTLAVSAAVMAATGALIVPAVASTAAYCGQTWGSVAKHAAGSGASLSAVRAGRHGCYDRLVIDLNSPAGGYDVAYAVGVATQGQGAPISLRGGAFLDVTINAPTYDTNGIPTYAPSNRADVVDVSGYRTFRQVAFGGSFEGITTFAVGVRARLPFRAFLLGGPGLHSRIVIDVGHQW